MAVTRYIPDRDPEFDEWLENFAQELIARGLTFGFSLPETIALGTANADWHTGFVAHLDAQEAARMAREAKDALRTAAEALARPYAARLQAHPAMTDEVRQAFRITVPDRVRTPVPAPATAPLGEVDTSRRLEHRVFFWHVDAEGGRRGKAPEASACEIWIKMGGAPPSDLSECQFVAAPSKSPFQKVFSGGEANQTVHYILRWKTATGLSGPLSETLSATVPA